jgi:hypothetical protein
MQGTRNKGHGTRNKQERQEGRRGERAKGNREQGTRSKEQGKKGRREEKAIRKIVDE